MNFLDTVKIHFPENLFSLNPNLNKFLRRESGFTLNTKVVRRHQFRKFHKFTLHKFVHQYQRFQWILVQKYEWIYKNCLLSFENILNLSIQLIVTEKQAIKPSTADRWNVFKKAFFTGIYFRRRSKNVFCGKMCSCGKSLKSAFHKINFRDLGFSFAKISSNEVDFLQLRENFFLYRK